MAARKRKAKGGTGSALVDTSAKARLQAAAEAAGFDSVEQLANLVVDSGILATPPEGDGVSQVYTLDDLGRQMHAQMPPDGRPEWFDGLVETQRTALITMLRSRGYASMVIARDFGITESDVNKVYERYADELGGQVINVRLNTLVGNLQIAAERAGQMAMSKEDAATYWRIQKEMIALLQSLGIVKQAIRKVEVAHHFDDQKQAEINAMLDLERKQAARTEELKQAEFQLVDEVPQLSLAAPDSPASMQRPFGEDEE